MNVAVIGASDNPERYSYKAVKLLAQKNHRVYPIHPKLASIDGHTVFSSLGAVPDRIDTVTVYVSPEISSSLAGDIISARPSRVIFNPGAENPALAEQLEKQGIQTVEACSLVLLTTGRF